jgi:hypothetical protein
MIGLFIVRVLMSHECQAMHRPDRMISYTRQTRKLARPEASPTGYMYGLTALRADGVRATRHSVTLAQSSNRKARKTAPPRSCSCSSLCTQPIEHPRRGGECSALGPAPVSDRALGPKVSPRLEIRVAERVVGVVISEGTEALQYVHNAHVAILLGEVEGERTIGAHSVRVRLPLQAAHTRRSRASLITSLVSRLSL